MNQKLLSKILATMLTVILTFTNFVLLGVYATNSYATEDSLENQKTVSNNENVKFDAYFVDEKGNKIHTQVKDIDEHMKLFLEIQVDKGYLKNSKIKMLGQDGKEANFRIASKDQTLDMVESVDAENNIIALKQMNSGTNVILQVPIASTYSELFDLSNFSKINNITLTGSYVDNSGKQIQIEKTINTRNEWGKETKAVVEQETKTYMPYEVSEKTGTILQTLVKTSLENNSLPTKQTKITVNVPEINGVKPEEIIVTANNTYATNNQGADKFTNNNWSYDKEKGTISIEVKNEPNENKVAWKKNVTDEYVITYIFKEKVGEIQTEQKVDVEIESYNNVTTKLTANNTLNIEEDENKGNIVTTKITSNNQLSKGYLYSNSQNEIEYFENIKLDIGYTNLIDKIVVENSIDNYINSKEETNPTTVNNKNYAYYKTTTINKENFERILGEEGYIKIIGKDGERLATFTKDTESDEVGNYTYNYESEINEIKIETSKPINEGTLEINHIKSLKGKTDYSKKQIADFQKLQLKTITTVQYADTEIEKYGKIRNIELTLPTTKIEASVNKTDLSTIVKNENVEFRVALKTNDISCDLYKNPSLEIVLPSYIQKVDIKDVDLLFDNELKIKEYNQYVNSNGNIVIKITLQGEQNTYSQNEVSKGANIVINTDVLVKELSPTKSDVVKVYVTNQNATSYENTENLRGYVETELKAVAPTGIVTTNTINYKDDTVTTVSGEEASVKLDVKSDSKIATVSANIINNYENKINNIKVLGTLPKAGNLDPATGKDLGSNFDTSIVEPIKLTNIKGNIYYSANSKATTDITNPENGWTQSLENISNAKVYLIDFENYEMKTGDMGSLEYKVQIPANLEYDETAYTNYVVYFDNVKETENIKDKQIATKIGMTTGEGPHLEVALRSDVGLEEVQEGNRIKYTASVKNIGNTTINNVTLSGNVPEGTIYVYYEGMEGTEDPVTKIYDANKKEYAETIQELKPGESKIIQYEVEASALLKETEKTIETKATAKVENYEAMFTSSVVTNKIVKGYLNVSMELQPSYTTKKEGQEINYITTISNPNMDEKENIVVTSKLPEGVTFISSNNNGVYNKDTNVVTWNIDKITGRGVEKIILKVKIDELKNGQTKKEITNTMTIKTNEKELQTNEVSFTVIRPVLSIKQETSTNEKVVIGDTISYNVTIQNIGETDVSNIVVKDYLPNGLRYSGATYVVDGKTYTSWIGNTDATINISLLKAGKTADITIKAYVDNIDENKTERQITNIVQLTADDITKIGSNEVTHTIVEKTVTEDPSVEEPEDGTYKISGLVWLDSNGNGRRDDDETTFGNVKVMLVDSNTGKIVKDPVTGLNKEQNINEQGIYTFSNLRQGKYLVVFFYDTENYGVTKYKADGVIDTKNSDAISMNVTLNGKTSAAAVANSIEIQNNDITNIDMGLIRKAKFDLKLDKTVSKIIVNNTSGAKEYNYNDAKFAKVDIKDKLVDETTIIVEYKIKVTNEGEVAGYAKKIVDYIPSDMVFNSELNEEWYIGESGNAYNASLANTLINPGETKEVTLVLTKKMTNDNTGTINNIAEIYEASNDYGLQDVDSTVANKVQEEDDYSLADVVIGVKTGEVYVYVVITLISIIILGIGTYFINKKVLKKM